MHVLPLLLKRSADQFSHMRTVESNVEEVITAKLMVLFKDKFDYIFGNDLVNTCES